MAYQCPIFLEQLSNGTYQVRMQGQVFSANEENIKKPHGRVARLNRNKTQGLTDSKGKSLGSTYIKTSDLKTKPSFETFNTDVAECDFEVGENCINFKIKPGTNKSVCHFNIPYRIDPIALNIVLSLDSIQFISFIINDTPFCFQGEALDITKHIREGQNEIIFFTTNVKNNIDASIQWRMGSELEPSTLANEILSKAKEMEVDINGAFVQDTDPTTHLPISIAARGANCTHAQAFDAHTFLKRGFATGDWNCPVCHIKIEPDQIRTDPSYLKQCETVYLEDDAKFKDPFNYF